MPVEGPTHADQWPNCCNRRHDQVARLSTLEILYGPNYHINHSLLSLEHDQQQQQQSGSRVSALPWEIQCVLHSSCIVDCCCQPAVAVKNVWPTDERQTHFLAQEASRLNDQDYEIVYPVASTSSRTKRSIHQITNETDFIIQAFGKNFHFDWLNQPHNGKSILSPNFVVQRIGNKTTWLDQEAADRDVNWQSSCLRVGTVNGDVESTAVMDLCWNTLHNLKKPVQQQQEHEKQPQSTKFDRRGLMGVFHNKDGDYILQPAGDLFSTNSKPSSNLPPHIVYRTRNGTDHSDTDKSQHSVDSPAVRNVRTAANGRRRRREIDASEFAMGAYEYHVELLVVADYSMRQFHGKDLNEYILTLMSIVGMIYRDASIGNSLTITVAKLITLESDTEGPRVSWSAQETLESFCKWQATYNSQEDADPHHHDAAVLITRQDLCRVKNKCDTLGLAEIGTMCDTQKSCAIVEDSGLSSAFTIAHELGHLFNLPHDDDRTCRNLVPTGAIATYTNVMAPRLDHNSNPWTWSACSAKKLLDYLESGEASCLLDEPSSNSNHIPTRQAYLTQGRSDYQLDSLSVNSFLFPGEMFDVDKQCQLVFGEGAVVCPFMPVCKRLWCTTTLGNQTGCRTQHLPWADGSQCGWSMWCKRGECVKKDFTRLDPLDGSWGSWSRWGRCSRTCGGGIKESFRECDNPKPLNGGKYCVGQRVRYKSCNIKDCAADELDFREEQCAAFNGKTMGYQGVEPSVIWTAKLYGDSRQKCKLYCQVERTNKFFQLKDKVIDGTSCGTDPADICVNGICKKAGCDGRLGSQMRRDICGVCGGDNSTCRTVTGTYNEQKDGYNFIIDLPEGASNIDIRQHAYEGMKDDFNYLALVNSKGAYLFNGGFVVSLSPIKVTVKNAMIDYTGSDTIVERVNCTDAIGEGLSLYVLTAVNLYPPDVYYSYMVSVGDEYRWDPEGTWNSCNKECKGIQYRNLLCVRKSDRQLAAKGNCMGQALPQEHSRTCNDHCTLRWDVQEDPGAQCSAKCNERGTIHRRIRCLKETTNDIQAEAQLHYQDNTPHTNDQSPRTQEVDVDKCHELSEPKPVEELPCLGSCRLVSWKYTDWNECSRQCGGGTQTRASVCVDVKTGAQVPPYNCSFHQTPEPSQRPCNPQPCAADWTVGAWGVCSVSCGKGVMQRAVKCLLRSEQVETDDSLCDPLRKPQSKSRCPETPCPPPPISRPPPMPRPPPVVHAPLMSDQPSEGEWVTGEWTACSRTCGGGERYRSVGCRGRINGEYLAHVACVDQNKPQEREACFVVECGNWQFGEWGKCTAHCDDGLGGAMQRRYVACVVGTKVIKDEDECDKHTKPPSTQRCPNLPQCESETRMRIVDSGGQSHGGDALRLLKYETFVEFTPPPTTTQKSVKPGISARNRVLERLESQRRQAVWITGAWGKCSRACGGGMRQRLVACQGDDGLTCDEGNKPGNSSRCNDHPCPEWKFGQWGQCNSTCGTGFQRRIVQCVDTRGSHMSNYQCARSRRPPNIQRCNEQSCSNDEPDEQRFNMANSIANPIYQPAPDSPQHNQRGVWQAGQWTPCSVSCGRGIRQRIVYCADLATKSRVEDSRCTGEKPSGVEDCRTEACAKWRVSKWGECSTDCGVGFRTREVLCARGGLTQRLQASMVRVNETLCQRNKRPKAKRSCEVYECPNGKFLWSVSNWLPCSASCDSGKQLRHVRCLYKGNNSLVDNLHCRNERAKAPATSKVCYTTKHCAFRWMSGEWSECSRSCGSGVRYRHLNCHKVDETGTTIWYPTESPYRCDTRNKPKERQLCSFGRCADHFLWQSEAWTQCTKSCDGGLSKRNVHCVHQKAQQRLRPSFCRANLKPETTKTCNPESCRQKPTSNRIY